MFNNYGNPMTFFLFRSIAKLSLISTFIISSMGFFGTFYTSLSGLEPMTSFLMPYCIVGLVLTSFFGYMHFFHHDYEIDIWDDSEDEDTTEVEEYYGDEDDYK